MKRLPGTKRWMSLWRHFYERERTVDELTTSMIEWQERWRWDFLKLNPPACYHALDWGAQYEFFTDPLKEPKLVKPVVLQPQDVDRIHQLDPTIGVLGEQLQVIRNLRKHFGGELPIVETIFSPIEIAHRLMTGREALTALRKSDPARLHRLLNTIAHSYQRFAVECLKNGADGIFFATKWANSDQMTWDEYVEFGKRYETPFLEMLNRENALVILHVCGARTFLSRMADYPVEIFSYDFHADGVVDPLQLASQTGKHVLGGIDPEKLVNNPDGVLSDCNRYRSEKLWIAGPSCVVLPQTPESSIEKLRELSG